MSKILINPKLKSSVNQPSIKIPKLFNTERVFIIGGGSSLANFDFKILIKKNIIAINKAFLFVPFANILYFSDYRFYTWYKNDIANFNGDVYSISNKVKDPKVKILKNTGKLGLDTTDGCIRSGGNSGYAAINLAYHLGANEIILMGYDMQSVDNKTHFHGGYSVKQSEAVYKNFLESFDSIRTQIPNVKIYNTSLDSKLTVFEKKDVSFFL